uniref:hypothetical protein n=1 Tax=Parerythrobacter lutipelagi TaxID=1964208 RepID=UPI0010F9BE99|nr:hypothetical protein [Parerythrobacter lutipelagi]
MKKTFVLLAALSLGACANPYVATPYTAPAGGLTSVGIADDSIPEDAIAGEAASTMSNFGLLGALVDAGVQASRKSRVNEALDSVNYQPEEMFEAYLIEAFKKKNINAMLLAGPDREKREFLTDYQDANGAQAVLDFNVTEHGYINAGNQLWRPAVAADVRLVDAVSGKTLMENRIVLNPIVVQEGTITLSPNPDYVFQNREDMISQPERLAAGIDDALMKVADAAVNLLQ